MYSNNLYSTFNYSNDKRNDEGENNIVKVNLLEHLPSFYANSNYVKNIMESDSREVEFLLYAIDDLKKQFYVNTATWGLEFYERDLGLKVDINKPYRERRDLIKSKLRGQGTTTIQMIKDTAKAFTNVEVDVIEIPSEYKFIVKFIGEKGIPRNLQDFKSMLETIKPAHLVYELQYTYTVWDFIMQDSPSWESLNTKTWNDLKVYDGGLR